MFDSVIAAPSDLPNVYYTAKLTYLLHFTNLT